MLKMRIAPQNLLKTKGKKSSPQSLMKIKGLSVIHLGLAKSL
jgi:hypothetical protein